MSVLAKLKSLRSTTFVPASMTAEPSLIVAAARQRYPDPADEIDAYQERIAVCLASDDVCPALVQEIAYDEVGNDLDALVHQQIEYWLCKLTTLPPPDELWMTRLLSECQSLLHAKWMFQAIKLGWTDAELFGLHMYAPRQRFEAMGLLVSLACSPLRRPFVVTSVSTAEARFVTRDGGQLTYRRFRPCLGPPIWEHPTFIDQGELR